MGKLGLVRVIVVPSAFRGELAPFTTVGAG